MAPHAGFIIAAYAVTVVVLAGTVAAVLIDYRSQRRMLARLGGRIDPAEREGGRDDDAR